MKQIYIDKFLEGCESDDSDLDDSDRESEEQLMSVLQKLPDEAFETTMQIKSDLEEKGLNYASREFWRLCRKYLSDDKALMKLITQLEEEDKKYQ